MEKIIIHKAETRGTANFGWLNSYHTFSFGHYFDASRTHFGVLRVLNDDTVSGGKGFGAHPHDNMEIISIPLLGDLEHQDSMGNKTVIKQGDVQIMSAGTGVTHSEYNKNEDQEVKFLQIWVFPNKRNVSPRYDQITLNLEDRVNKFQQIISPNVEDEGMMIKQDAWFHIGKFDSGKTSSYKIKKEGNGVYAFIIEGDVKINGQELSKRDGIGITESSELKIIANTNAEILLMEIPMNA